MVSFAQDEDMSDGSVARQSSLGAKKHLRMLLT
jgi:hypothetical protein